jgi:ribonuclease HI
MRAKQGCKTKAEEPKAVEIYIDGGGARPDGKGSGFAWIAPEAGKSGVEWQDGLTNNQAEYHALLAAVTWLLPKSVAVILTDSQLLCEQFNRRYQVYDPALARLLWKIRGVITEKSLDIQVNWLPGPSNPADKLLKRNCASKIALSEKGRSQPNVTLKEPSK